MNSLIKILTSFFNSVNKNKLSSFSFILTSLIISLSSLITIYLLQQVINNLMLPDVNKEALVVNIVLMSVVPISLPIITFINLFFRKKINNKLATDADMKAFNTLVNLPLSYTDTQKGRKEINMLWMYLGVIRGIFFDIIQIISLVISFAITFIYIFKYNYIFAIILLLAFFPKLMLGYLEQKTLEKNKNDAYEVSKFSYYYSSLLSERNFAYDVRVYNLLDDFKNNYLSYKKDYFKLRRKYKTKYFLLNTLINIVEQLGIIFFIAYLIFSAVEGNINVGQVVFYSGYAISLVATLSVIASIVSRLAKESIYDLVKVEEFFSIEQEQEDQKIKVDSFLSLEFDNVFFKYPTAKNFILSGITFKINRGQKVAFLGVNGAGKTTIIKLIIGLYKINSGSIMLNGRDINEFDIKSVRKLFSVLFQDFIIYPLTLKENVGLSNIGDIVYEESIIEALKRVDFINYDLENYVTKQFDDNGIELSVGQKQKLAIARTYFKNSPVIILDEPSSSLDAIAEDEIINNFIHIANDKTGIIITHKISSSLKVDLIFIINDGLIEECGTHTELLDKKGIYYNMYNLQKEKYKR